jgi:exonuclease III
LRSRLKFDGTPHTTKNPYHIYRKLNNINSLNLNIRIFHQNIEHLPSRLDSLKIIIDEIQCDIFVITEHNMKNWEIDRINIDNYYIASSYCRHSTNKGGVLIFSRHDLKVSQVSIPFLNQLAEDKQFEFCVVKCVSGQYEFVLVGMYRSPSSNVCEFLDRLNTLIECLCKKFKSIIIAGDFNINVLTDNADHFELKNVLKSNGLSYCVNFPTRICKDSESSIDNVFTNISGDKIKVEGVITMLSDHDGQIIDLNFQNSKIINESITKTSRCFSNENIKTFIFYLTRENWIEVFLAVPDKKYETFFNIFQYYFNISFEIKKIKQIFKKNEWMNVDLKNEKQELINLSKTARLNRNSKLFDYVRNRNKLFREK